MSLTFISREMFYEVLEYSLIKCTFVKCAIYKIITAGGFAAHTTTYLSHRTRKYHGKIKQRVYKS